MAFRIINNEGYVVVKALLILFLKNEINYDSIKDIKTRVTPNSILTGDGRFNKGSRGLIGIKQKLSPSSSTEKKVCCLIYFIRFSNYWQGHRYSMTPISAGP